MTENNRVGSWCWYKIVDTTRGPANEWRRGTVLAWSTDSDESEAGFGHFPVAVVEDNETCEVRSVYVTRVNFSEQQPSE